MDKIKWTLAFFLLCLPLLLNTKETDSFHKHHTGLLRNWESKRQKILNPTQKQPSRTAVLIIAPPHIGNSYTECRWKLGKKVWEQYMNAVPNVDCYFIQSTCPRKGYKEQVWCEGNTIYVGDSWYENYGNDRILHKTIEAIEQLLPHYTHFIRTNINSFFNLKAVNEYMETHHESMYTGPLWEKSWYVYGYGIFFTADVAAHIASEYRRLEGLDIVSCYRADDSTLASLATGVYPFSPSEHLFCCSPKLPFGIRQLMCKNSLSATRLNEYGAWLLPPISLKKAIKYCDQAANTVMLYRIREGFELDQLAELYQYLLHKIYPELPCIDLVEYAQLLHSSH